MKTIVLVLSLIVGCVAVSCIAQERVCTPSGCYFVPASSVPYREYRQIEVKVPSTRTLNGESIPVVESHMNWQEVVVSQPVRQPLRRVLANRPVRGFLKRVFCR